MRTTPRFAFLTEWACGHLISENGDAPPACCSECACSEVIRENSYPLLKGEDRGDE